MGLPVLHVEGLSIAEAWEKSLVALSREGLCVRTEYDRPGDQPSVDAAMTILVRDPLAEPRIHLAFPGGIEDLEKYRQEVVEGVHDSWINPDEGMWTYTYHDRLFNYRVPGAGAGVDQVERIVTKLAEAPHSRRAQAITWIPAYDPGTADPPCLQRVWCRVIEEAGESRLIMHAHWRSRDAARAAFMNLFGLTDLQRSVAERVAGRLGRPVAVGHYLDVIDSYHIYGDCLAEVKARFLKMLETRDFFNEDRTRSRTMRSDDPAALEAFELGRRMLALERETGKKGATL